eukprot:scaffold134679_cov27-Tisochrysis_lutea.AAC.2
MDAARKTRNRRARRCQEGIVGVAARKSKSRSLSCSPKARPDRFEPVSLRLPPPSLPLTSSSSPTSVPGALSARAPCAAYIHEPMQRARDDGSCPIKRTERFVPQAPFAGPSLAAPVPLALAGDAGAACRHMPWTSRKGVGTTLSPFRSPSHRCSALTNSAQIGRASPSPEPTPLPQRAFEAVQPCHAAARRRSTTRGRHSPRHAPRPPRLQPRARGQMRKVRGTTRAAGGRCGWVEGRSAGKARVSRSCSRFSVSHQSPRRRLPGGRPTAEPARG